MMYAKQSLKPLTLSELNILLGTSHVDRPVVIDLIDLPLLREKSVPRLWRLGNKNTGRSIWLDSARAEASEVVVTKVVFRIRCAWDEWGSGLGACLVGREG